MEDKRRSYLRKIPAVNDLLAEELGQELIAEYGHQLLLEEIRSLLDRLRKKILDASLAELEAKLIDLRKIKILKDVREELRVKKSSKLMPVINATGVVIHTNLGRSLLSQSAQEALERVSKNYSTLEVDRVSGERGSRYEVVEEILKELTGAEAALVVNNNAAAVLLILSTLAKDKEVIISRGQLVEIGGSFRIPAVMEQSGAKLKEVGCTNKVHLADYQEAIREETALILKVHTSNYKVVGFTKEASLKELVNLAHHYDLPVIEDLGSGSLVDLRPWGLSYEPTVQESIAAGVDILSFSGDKLLGGPQAGIIVGKKKYIDQMKEHQLNRALRVDKFTLAALEATLAEYRNLAEVQQRIPTLKMLTISLEELKAKAEDLLTLLRKHLSSDFKVGLRRGNSQVGGGAYPTERLETYVIDLSSEKYSIQDLAQSLRLNNPPIFTRIYQDALIFDVRTIQEEDFEQIVKAFEEILREE
ncbi:L-seryl-tRNA(Sec) selenium transferase [Orenia marismortui]|uniref:L-seryl-tRNA(Sec) selenium transferase n=1 Tax=Orenia marismortui TaxID=46469 RepID=A0A4R8H339_9FIRM|nr:L-seryl-tRNA(Sec) selenium transferase [Orenia marismortui]TDX53150.1 L-seryl-tRNA(Sec) selenium transferase [Orenia marismortui]